MFWRRTPRQIVRTIKAQTVRLTREKNDRICLAWLTAYLSRIDPKKFPELEKLLVKPNARKRFQDPEARWRALATISQKR